MQEMTPMAERQSSVDLVKDSSVGGICWERGKCIQICFDQLAAQRICCTWSMILVSAENLFRICPRGVTSKNLRGKQFVKCSPNVRQIWKMRRSRMWTERQISLRLGSATWWGHGWSCSAGCDAGSWPKKDPETPPWARWWGTRRSLQRTRRWRPNSRGHHHQRPVTIATHERIQSFSATSGNAN